MPNVTTTRKSDIDPTFEKQLTEMKDQAKDDFEQRSEGKQVQWNMPKKLGWSGDLWDWEGMKKPFDRKFSNEKYEEACKEQMAPGRTGDLIITTTQIGLLSTMERAFRARHAYHFPRGLAQNISRRKGHGEDKGTFKFIMLDYVRSIIKQTSENQHG